METRHAHHPDQVRAMDTAALRRSGDGNMIATGARRFVEQIDELLRAGLPSFAQQLLSAGAATGTAAPGPP